jgi:hypothetical protein
VLAAEPKASQHGAHLLRLEPALRELVEQVLHRVLVKRECVHKVLVVAPDAQLVAAAGLTSCRLKVTWGWGVGGGVGVNIRMGLGRCVWSVGTLSGVTVCRRRASSPSEAVVTALHTDSLEEARVCCTVLICCGWLWRVCRT